MHQYFTLKVRGMHKEEREKKEGMPLAPNGKGHEFGVRVPGVKEKKR